MEFGLSVSSFIVFGPPVLLYYNDLCGALRLRYRYHATKPLLQVLLMARCLVVPILLKRTSKSNIIGPYLEVANYSNLHPIHISPLDLDSRKRWMQIKQDEIVIPTLIIVPSYISSKKPLQQTPKCQAH